MTPQVTSSSSSADPILSVTSLRVWFPGRTGFSRRTVVRAVDGVDFQIGRGETLALVGESGSGKTTVAGASLRLVKPTDGSVRFMGENLIEMNRPRVRTFRREVQAVFQNPYTSLNPRRRVRDIIAEPLKVHGLGERESIYERVVDLLQEVGLQPDHGERFPHEFSGGQRQRIAIARALAVRPSLIVCDEPTSALDVSVQAQIINLLKSLQEEHGISLLFISHDLGVVRSISHRVAVMYLGRIVETAHADELYRNPKHPYTKALLSSVLTPLPSRERMRGNVQLGGSVPNPAQPPPGCHFSPRCPDSEDLCFEVNPKSVPVGTDHIASCHLFGELLNRSTIRG